MPKFGHFQIAHKIWGRLNAWSGRYVDLGPRMALFALLDRSHYAFARWHNGVWWFYMLDGAWDRYQLGKAEAAGLWPAPRESASLSSGGWMFGGSSIYGDSTWGRLRTPGSTECVGDVSSPLPSATHRLLSGLWRWQDSADTVFYE